MILAVIILFLVSLPGAAENSYYRYDMKVGEHISTIENRLSLFYTGRLNSYDTAISLELNKEDRFLEGIRRSKDVEYDDYYMAFYKDRVKFQLGLVSTEGNLSALTSDRLLGSYFRNDEYEFWVGNAIEEGLGLSSSNNFQWGINYREEGRQITYQSIEEKTDYNHYLSYQDNIFLEQGSLFWDLDTGLNSNDELYGFSNRLGYSTELRDINYILSGTYTSADYSALESDNDIGYGNYSFDLSANKRINSFLINSDLRYKRNNLNQELTETTHDWENSWEFDYYPKINTKYYLDLTYNTQLSYAVSNGELEQRIDDFDVEVGQEKNYLTTSLQYNLLENIDQSEEAVLEIDYFPGAYRLLGRYLWSKEDGWESELEASYNYSRRVNTKVDYEAEVEFVKEDSKSISWRQELFYQLAAQQRMILNLNLSKELSLSEVDKILTLNYEYRF